MPVPRNIRKAERTRRPPSRRVLSFVDDGQQNLAFHDVFGKRIKELREQAGLTQEGLAKLVGIDRSYLAQIERGRRRLSLEIAYRIAKGLGSSLDNMLTGIAKRT